MTCTLKQDPVLAPAGWLLPLPHARAGLRRPLLRGGGWGSAPRRLGQVARAHADDPRAGRAAPDPHHRERGRGDGHDGGAHPGTNTHGVLVLFKFRGSLDGSYTSHQHDTHRRRAPARWRAGTRSCTSSCSTPRRPRRSRRRGRRPRGWWRASRWPSSTACTWSRRSCARSSGARCVHVHACIYIHTHIYCCPSL